MTAGAAIGVVGLAMGLVRLGWGGRRGIALLGWAVAIVALALLVARYGAWGLASGTVAGMVAALVIVLYAAATSPAKAVRAPRVAPAITLPRRRHDLFRRFGVFVLVVPIAFVASVILAFGAQALARNGGWADADSAVLMLFVQPVAWLAVMSIQLTRANAWRMLAAPAVAALIGAILWGIA